MEEHQEGRVETIVKYTWTINNFSKLKCEELCSETFFTGIHPWRIIIYPKWSIVDAFTIYLNAGDTANLPIGWSKYANFKLSLINQVDGTKTRTRENEHLFDASCDDFGYQSFMSSAEFRDPSKGFLVNDTCIIVAEVSAENSGHEDTNDDHPHKQMSSASHGELMDFNGLCKIEKQFVQLLEEACSKHPTLSEFQRKRKRSERFTEWSFTALGRVLQFLKTKKVKDMNDDDTCQELLVLWEELGTCGFDLTWLEPHVHSALGVKDYTESEMQVKKLKGHVIDLEVEFKSLKAKMAAAEADLEIARRDLMKAEDNFVKRDLDDELGYGIP